MYRKISAYIEDYFNSNDNKILCIDGARQVGKTYIIRELGKKHYPNYIEINFADDKTDEGYFANVSSIDDFYLVLTSLYNKKLHDFDNTLIFIDEIQTYPKMFSLLKGLANDNRYKFICSGSELGIFLSSEYLSPLGYVIKKRMYPMDFEEFLLANDIAPSIIDELKKSYENRSSINESLHKIIFKLFRTYLLTGGMPNAVKTFITSRNINKLREVQTNIIDFYKGDAAKYGNNNRLKIIRLYELLPSSLENKVKRIQFTDIENKHGTRYNNYLEEFDYLIYSGITLEAKSISEPRFPLIQSSNKNLIKLYFNDVGLLTSILYGNNINVLLDLNSNQINLGAVYETFAAQELASHNHKLFYFDRKKLGEVDFLVDDFNNLSVLPIEIKSGNNYRNFKAISKMIETKNYNIKKGYVFSNSNSIREEKDIIYMPIYLIMFI